MKSHHALLTVLLLLPAPTRGDNTFSPVEPALFEHHAWEKYFHFLKRSVFRNFSATLPVVFCAIESFTPEWGITLADNYRRGYLLKLSVAPKNMWYAGALNSADEKVPTPEERARDLLPQLQPHVIEKSIPHAFGLRIEKAWHAVLFTATIKRDLGGLDGTTYYFFAHDLNYRAFSGKRWTPPPDSGAGRLTTLAHALRELAENAPDAERGVELALQSIENWPNKAPEPTPTAVTPRATEGASK